MLFAQLLVRVEKMSLFTFQNNTDELVRIGYWKIHDYSSQLGVNAIINVLPGNKIHLPPTDANEYTIYAKDYIRIGRMMSEKPFINGKVGKIMVEGYFLKCPTKTWEMGEGNWVLRFQDDPANSRSRSNSNDSSSLGSDPEA